MCIWILMSLFVADIIKRKGDKLSFFCDLCIVVAIFGTEIAFELHFCFKLDMTLDKKSNKIQKDSINLF